MWYKIEQVKNVKKGIKLYKLPIKTMGNLLVIICNSFLQNSLKVPKDNHLLMIFFAQKVQ